MKNVEQEQDVLSQLLSILEDANARIGEIDGRGISQGTNRMIDNLTTCFDKNWCLVQSRYVAVRVRAHEPGGHF